jgi:D-sedoheptulose 7-phosphate isomerase
MNIDRIIDESAEAIQSIRTLKPLIETGIEILVNSLQSGGKILACGNGGSAADASHFTTEFLCRFVNDRPSLPAISLNCDGSFLTATSNDYGYDYVFARQIEGLGKAEDVLVGITTSGNSSSVTRAIETAKERGMKTIALLGRDGGMAKGLADVDLVVPVNATARIQEAHTVIIHLLCGGTEARIFPEVAQD